jgi:hypothetical protein
MRQTHLPVQELQTILITWPFTVWGLDMVGSFQKAHGGYDHLLVAVDKFSKWIEAKPVAQTRFDDTVRDGNGYPTPETWRVFTLLGYGYGLISIPVGFLMGDNLYPAGMQARAWDRSTQTRKPTGFLNPT